MALQLGDTAPGFVQDSTHGRLRLHDYLGDSWGVLFSRPVVFMPVCTTDLGAVAPLKRAFDDRGVGAWAERGGGRPAGGLGH